ncbi:MAG: prepilin-type N-terminal cleavage/methylation domain-containing protein [Candidatus Omnitrophica bacterium]|nr:prepilin-type N-terminal cleavage/methylation domain-containing protein [Candidatus Omnitrophota bacterium]
MRRARSRGGFTLLELMMVVIILAILAAIALPQYLRTSERARAAEALSALAAVRSSEIRAKALSNTGAYAAFADLDIDLAAAGKSWDFTVDAAGGTATAKRNGGDSKDKIIKITFSTGDVCTDDPATYGGTACAGAPAPAPGP